MRLSSIIAVFFYCCCSLVAGQAVAQSRCDQVAMTAAAEVSNDPGYEGLWKYTVQGSWDVGQRALSHMDVFLGLKECVCVCDEIVEFTSPSGYSNGESDNGPCTVIYNGQYLCTGDPAIPGSLRGNPAVKYEYAAGDCEPGVTGTGEWTFYSVLPPGNATTYVDAIAIKHGQMTCTGDVVGVLPSCSCPVPTESVTWGRVKTLYQ